MVLGFFVILFFILFVIFVIYLASKKSEIIGNIGEARCAALLDKLPKDKYIVVNDVMINGDSGSSQIDHVVLSIYGIFVIETKNYSGWIYGYDNSESWTKNVYGNKYSFYNPVKQNYGHIKAIKKFLNINSDVSVIGIVAFSDRAVLKIHSEKNVLNFSYLLDFIRRYNIQCYDYSELQSFADKLSRAANYSKEEKKEHVKEIKDKINSAKSNINANICPRCGSQLVERKGKYGTFLGCKNYPRCRFTKKL